MPDFGIFRGFGSKLFSDKLYAGQLPTQLGLIGSENALKYLLNSYPNAAAAYSLRLLNTAYTGSAIRVRRASDNAEQDIGFVNNVLDASSLTSFCSGTNGFVKTWYDQSGNSKGATQTTAANQPQIVSSGSVILDNGNPIVTFNGSSQFLETATSIISTDFAVFGVGNQDNSPNGVLFTQYNALTADRTLFYMENNDTRLIGIQIGTSSSKTGTPTFLQKLLYYNRLGSDIEYADNGSAVNTFVNSTVCQNAPLRMGALIPGTIQYTKQNIQELVIYATSQSSNRTGIESNINNFYSIY